MKTRYEIEMDFQAAQSAAEELERIAWEMKDVALRDMQETLSGIHSNWEGENAEMFLVKGQMVQGRIENTAESVMKVAKAIREIAERTKEAEMRAIAIAETFSQGAVPAASSKGNGSFGGGD